MAYASEKLYDHYIRKNMSRLATEVKVREIVLHLPCLTQIDREEIEAKRETAGNYNAMVVLLDSLRRRENWPDEFIRALMDTEHRTLSYEIQNAYDEMQGISSQGMAPALALPSGAGTLTVPSAPTPASPPSPASASSPMAASATITTATVHNVPRFVPHLLTPPPEEEPVQLSDPSSINPHHEFHPNTNVLEKAEAPASESLVNPLAEPVAHMEPPVSVSSFHVVPPAPVIVPNVLLSSEQNDDFHSAAAASILSISDDPNLTSLSGSSLSVPHLPPSNSTNVSLPESDSACTASQHPAAPEDTQVSVVATDDLISAKHPIQDTNPLQKVNISAEILTESSTVSQIPESVQAMALPAHEATQVRSPEILPAPVSDNTVGGPILCVVSEDDYFSKPGTLIGEESCSTTTEDLDFGNVSTENKGASSAQSASHAPASNLSGAEQQIQEPCSGSTNDELFSQVTSASSTIKPPKDAPDEQSSCSVFSVPVQEPVSVSDALENHYPIEESYNSHNQPAEDHYESFYPSLQSDQGTMLNVGQVCDEPSIQNLNGQSPSMIDNINHSIDDVQINVSLNSQTESHLTVHEDQPATHEQDNVQQGQGNNLYASEHAEPGVDLPAYAEPAANAEIIASPINTNQAEQGEQPEQSQGVLTKLQSDPRLIAVAAAVGVTAVFMAWKFK